MWRLWSYSWPILRFAAVGDDDDDDDDVLLERRDMETTQTGHWERHRSPTLSRRIANIILMGLLHVKCYGDSVFFCFCLFACLLVFVFVFVLFF